MFFTGDRRVYLCPWMILPLLLYNFQTAEHQLVRMMVLLRRRMLDPLPLNNGPQWWKIFTVDKSL
jgi:hypothetical protein